MITKPNGTIILTVRLTLKPGRDDDLIAILLAAPPRQMAHTIRQAMRSGISRPEAHKPDDFELPDIGIDL